MNLLTAMWYGECEMKKYEIEFAIVIVLLSIVVAIQAMLTEPCRQKQPMQINVYDRGQYK